MKKFIRCFILLNCLITLSMSAFSADKFVNGEGRFFAQDEDSLSFVKKQLLYSAFRDVLSQEMTAIGLDSATFWTAYDHKFDGYFEPIKKKLKVTYKIDDNTEVSEAQQEAYRKKLRRKKLTLMAKYGRLGRAITSYSIKKMTRSTQMANSRYLNLQARVNRKFLNNLYRKFTLSSKRRRYKKLYLTVNFSLEDMSWVDLGVGVESDFTTVVKEHWKRWVEDNIKGDIEEVIITDSSSESKLKEFIKIPQYTTQAIHNFTGVEHPIMKNVETGYVRIEDDGFREALWLDVKVEIKKKNEDKLLKQREFSFGGEFLLVDLKSNSLAMHFDFVKETAKFSFTKAHTLSSNAASLVYRLPMTQFGKIKSGLSSLPQGKKSVKLEVYNLASLAQLYSFIEILQSKGVTFSLSAQIESFSTSVAFINLKYSGSNEGLSQVLMSLHQLELDSQNLIALKVKDHPFSLTILKKEVVIPDQVPVEDETNDKIISNSSNNKG